MEITDININSSDDNIIAIIDGVVYAKGQRGKPRNPLRWREDGRHITGYLDKEKRIEYNQKYKELRICEICKKELQILQIATDIEFNKCNLKKKQFNSFNIRYISYFFYMGS